MAFIVEKVNDHPVKSDLKNYICQTSSDITKLPKFGVLGTLENYEDPRVNDPCAIGSTAFVIENSNVFMLDLNNTWVQL